MYYAKNALGLIRPSYSAERATCPVCGTEVIGHCGTRVAWYWAHADVGECETWSKSISEPKGTWHKDWQDLVNPEHGRVEVPIGRNGVYHFADIEAGDGTVIELQASGISREGIEEREHFYGRMVWIWDVTKPFAKENLTLHDEGGICHFWWTRPRWSIMDCRKPVFLDLGDHSIYVAQMIDQGSLNGVGTLVTKAQMVEWVNHGPPANLAEIAGLRFRVPVLSRHNSDSEMLDWGRALARAEANEH